MKTHTLFVVMIELHSGPQPLYYSYHYREMEKKLGECINCKNVEGKRYWLEEWQVTPVSTIKMS
jgi:hypothetical protein